MTLRGPISVLAIAMLVPSVALAHPAVDQGRTFYEEAQFLEALDAFATAEGADDLTREELVSLFETRALVHLAMGNEAPMRQDLQRLAALAPDHVLDRRVPPDVRRTFAEVRTESNGPIRLLAHPEASAAGVSIRAEAENDPLGIVRQVRIQGRTSAAAGWEHAVDAPLLVPLGDETLVEYYAEAIGPGGVVIASAGSSGEPLRFSGRAPAADESGGDDGVLIGVLAGLAVALAAGGVIVAVVIVTGDGGSSQTAVQPFTVRF